MLKQYFESEYRTYDYIVLGCGISALTAAKRLRENQFSVLVLESYPDAGGNHQSHIIDGMEFDIGSIYFNTDDVQFQHFPELLQECLPRDVEVKKICTAGVIGRYPFDWHKEGSSLNAREFIFCLWSLLRGRFRADRYDNARSYAQSRIGDRLYRRVGLDLYIGRLFGLEASRIDFDFALKRMQWLSRETSLRYRFRRVLRHWFTTARSGGKTVARPPGGFGLYYRKAVERLGEKGVYFGFGRKIVAIDRIDGLFKVTTTFETCTANKLVATIPLDEISRLCGLPEVKLPTVTLLSLFVALRGVWVPGCTVLYNFHAHGNWKRITVHSDFYPGSNAYDKHFTVEITIPPGHPVPAAQEAFSGLSAHLRELRLVEGELFLVGSTELENAYPIPEKGFKPRRDAAISLLASVGVICLGRQGKFEYIPHSNIAAREAIATLNQSVMPGG